MTIKSRTSFDIEKFNKMIGEYAEQGYPLDLPTVTGYDDFVHKYPPLSKKALMQVSDTLIDAGKLQHCYVISTSGTTSAPLVLASRIFQRVTEDSYPYQVRGFMAEHVFCAEDTVVNLLTAGCLGYNYEGMCRMLEPIGSTVLPVGRPRRDEQHAVVTRHHEEFQRKRIGGLTDRDHPGRPGRGTA
ncbi:hypothetical protein RHM58_17485 [Pseudomonas sp. 10S4]|uniref:hypothetical protein n=1 Tax=Pseudomonas sp. 10S4 TaxID=3048583 RepID=UPI002AC92E71|nr:hypothetical protein [Pseudomonas sp. 10S4]WPX15905.1 hypothetical protein RHM58_17485 [Pseudomonas sp. 10S4]